MAKRRVLIEWDGNKSIHLSFRPALPGLTRSEPAVLRLAGELTKAVDRCHKQSERKKAPRRLNYVGTQYGRKTRKV